MLCSVAASQERALKRRLTAHEQRLSNFSNQKNINKEAVMHDLEDTKTAIHKLEREITEWNDQFAKLVRSDRFNNDQAFQGRQVDYLKVLLEQRAQMRASCKTPNPSLIFSPQEAKWRVRAHHFWHDEVL